MAREGKVTALFPPGNNGKQRGAGQLTDNSTGDMYVFQTPQDATGTIAIDMKVVYEVGNGGNATGVKSATSEG